MARLGNREDAEDVAIEVVEALPNPCFRRNLKLYVVGVARRKIADRLRASRPTEILHEGQVQTRFDLESDNAALLRTAFGQLTEDHHELLVLKYAVGLSSAEIGGMFGKRADAVDSQLQRARDSFMSIWTRLTTEEVKV